MSKRKRELTKEQYEKLCFTLNKYDLEIIGKETELEDLKVEIREMKKDYKIGLKMIDEYRATHKEARDEV